MYSPIVEFLRIKAEARVDAGNRLWDAGFHGSADDEYSYADILRQSALIAQQDDDGIVAAVAKFGWHPALKFALASWHSDFLTLDKQLAQQRFDKAALDDALMAAPAAFA